MLLIAAILKLITLVPLRDIEGIDMRLKYLKYPILCFFLLCLAGCKDNVSFVKVESERTKLICGIESYQSIDDFKLFLSKSKIQWEESKGQSSIKGRPPFDMYTIIVKNYSHLDSMGELNIGFFNNRLIGTTFYPNQMEAYLHALEKYEGIKFDHRSQINIPAYTCIVIATDYKGQKYIRWSDTRLDKEVELWIKKYS